MYLGSKRPREAAIEEDERVASVQAHINHSNSEDTSHSATIAEHKTAIDENKTTLDNHAALHSGHTADFGVSDAKHTSHEARLTAVELASTNTDIALSAHIAAPTLADVIDEKTPDTGVTVDSVLLKDGKVSGRDVAADGAVLDTYADLVLPLVFSTSTGVATGGELQIGTGGPGVATTFSIADGTGHLVDDAKDTVQTLTWSGHTDVGITYLNSDLLTWVSIDSAGTVVQRNTPWSNSNLHDEICIGVVVHIDKLTVAAVNQEQSFSRHPGLQLHEFMRNIGFLNGFGNVFSPVAGLTFQKSFGKIIYPGINYINDPKNPNELSLPALNPVTFQYRYRDGTNGVTGTNLIPGEYDDGSGALNPGLVSNNNYSIQRVFSFTSNSVKIQPGQDTYSTMSAAVAALSTGAFITEQSIMDNGLLRGYIVLKGNASDATNVAQAQFFEASRFGGAATSASGVSTSSVQNTYDNSTSAPKIVTTVDGGPFNVKAGVADTETIFAAVNAADVETFTVTGAGEMTVATINGRGPTADGFALDTAVVDIAGKQDTLTNGADTLSSLHVARCSTMQEVATTSDVQFQTIHATDQALFCAKIDYTATPQNITSGATTTVEFQTVVYNRGGFTVDGSNYITLPISGTYQVNFNIGFGITQPTPQDADLMAWVDWVGGSAPSRFGCTRMRLPTSYPGTGYNLTTSFAFYFAAGTQLRPTVFQSTGATQTTSTSNSCSQYISIVKLH